MLLILLAAMHLAFPKRFSWREDFEHVSLFSRQMFYVHTWFIMLVVFLNGLLFLCLAPELTTPSRLSAGLMAGITLFWFARLVVQIFVYSTELWRGKKFETRVHIGAAIMWIYVTGSSGWALQHAIS